MFDTFDARGGAALAIAAAVSSHTTFARRPCRRGISAYHLLTYLLTYLKIIPCESPPLAVRTLYGFTRQVNAFSAVFRQRKYNN